MSGFLNWEPLRKWKILFHGWLLLQSICLRMDNTSVEYNYMAGRGQGVEKNTVRRLEEGVLPILQLHKQMMISNTESLHSLRWNLTRSIRNTYWNELSCRR